MNLHSSKNRKPTVLSKGISLAGFGAVAAAAALLSTADSAHAGAAELKALIAALKADNGATITSATADQLKNAVQTVIANNAKLKPGVVAGEALKFPAALSNDAGPVIAQLFAAADAATRVTIAGDAAKTAGSGKGVTGLQIPRFSGVVLNGVTSTQALAAAELARASKIGVGALLGGFANTLPEDQRDDLASGALTNKKLAGAATEISRFVASTFASASSTDEFAAAIAASNTSLLTKIAPGVAAGAPTNAAEVARQFLTSTNTGVQTAFQKGSALIAKSVAAVADIEQISLMGAYYADAIGNNVKGPNGKELVSLKSVVALTTTLAKAIVAKPSSAPPAYSAANRSDEIAEVAAYVVGGILGNAGLTEKTAPKLIVSIVKAAVNGGKTNKKQVALDADYIQDIAGSVATTLQAAVANNTITTALRDAIQAALVKGAKTIGGKTGATLVTNGLTEGFGTGATNGRAYENGFDLANIVDPETDNKNF